jgi:bidirectional [NiFe] hydrogenase diaphorase subunit
MQKSSVTTKSAETATTEKPTAVQKNATADKRFKVLDATMKRNQYRQDALIEILHKAQESFGYLEAEVLLYVARGLKLPLSRVYGVATFYHLFSLKPSGKHTCVVCLGTACYVKGSDKAMAALEQYTGIKSGETTPDGEISLLAARCIGACGIAPAFVFDGKVVGQLSPEAAIDRLKELQSQT